MPRKKTLDLTRIKGLVDTIDSWGAGNDPTDLIARLTQEEGLKTRFASGTYHANMAGIKVTCTESERGALRNWAQRARRELLKGAAA